MSVATTIRRYLADIGRAFDRAPVECAVTVAAAALLSYAIEESPVGAEVMHAVITILLVLAVSWAATLLHAAGDITTSQRRAVTMAGAAVAILFYLLTPNFERDSEGWRALMLTAGAALLVLAAPALRHAGTESNLRLRRINSRFLLRLIGITLYGLALFAGLAIAIAAVDNLFELKLDRRLYPHTFVWIMVVLVPWVVVGGLDDYVRPLDEQSDVARVVYRLSTYLVPPLVALYFIILLLYVVRILVTGELPKNLVSPMVIAAGLLSALALIVFDPPADSGHGLRWLRFTPFVFLPLVPLGVWALAARIDEYGWTEFRILRVAVLIVLCGLALAALLPVIRRRPLLLRTIPVALAVVLLLGAVGPWSVLNIARRSQQERLRTAFREANVDITRPVSPRDTATRVIPGAVYRNLVGSATYLQSHFGEEALREVAVNLPTGERAYAIAEIYNLRPDDRGQDVTSSMFGSMPSNQPFRMGDGQVMRINALTPPQGRDAQPAAGGPILRGTMLLVPLAGDTIRVELASLIAQMDPSNRRGVLPPDQVVLDAVDAAGTVRGHLTVMEISAETQGGQPRVSRLDGMLTLPRQLAPRDVP